MLVSTHTFVDEYALAFECVAWPECDIDSIRSGAMFSGGSHSIYISWHRVYAWSKILSSKTVYYAVSHTHTLTMRKGAIRLNDHGNEKLPCGKRNANYYYKIFLQYGYSVSVGDNDDGGDGDSTRVTAQIHVHCTVERP